MLSLIFNYGWGGAPGEAAFGVPAAVGVFDGADLEGVFAVGDSGVIISDFKKGTVTKGVTAPFFAKEGDCFVASLPAMTEGGK